MFKVFGDDPGHCFISIIMADGRPMECINKFAVESTRQSLSRHDQCSETFACHVTGLFFQPIIPLYNFRHHHISTFLQESNLPSLCVTNHNSHSLTFRSKWKDVKDVE